MGRCRGKCSTLADGAGPQEEPFGVPRKSLGQGTGASWTCPIQGDLPEISGKNGYLKKEKICRVLGDLTHFRQRPTPRRALLAGFSGRLSLPE